MGSKCIHYLLEKSRVVSQSTTLERNYHLFYQLLRAPEEDKQLYTIANKTPHDFIYTSEGDTRCSIIEGVSDTDRYTHTVEALELLGVCGSLRTHLFKALCGILHLGCVRFRDKTSENSDAVDLFTEEAQDTHTMNCVCECLGVDHEAFKISAISRTLDVEGEKLKVPLMMEQVGECLLRMYFRYFES